MRNHSDPWAIVRGVVNIHEMHPEGMFLVLVDDNASRHALEEMVRVFENEGIRAVVMTESLCKEIRFIDEPNLRQLQAAIREALGEIEEEQRAAVAGGMTPERVVAALRKRPDLLDGVRRILSDDER